MGRSRHRRAASRSGGATSAERDGRPVRRRNGPRGAAAERGFSKRAWRSQSSLKKNRHTGDRNATGETTGTAPVGPATRLTPLRSFSYTPEHENHGPRRAREFAHRRDVPLLENVLLTPRSRVGTFSRGAPPRMASRRSASQPPSRPSRRPEVADVIREGWAVHATAGRRAGAEARPAPKIMVYWALQPKIGEKVGLACRAPLPVASRLLACNPS
jgi:hypothetical protein